MRKRYLKEHRSPIIQTLALSFIHQQVIPLLVYFRQKKYNRIHEGVLRGLYNDKRSSKVKDGENK
jgi:hypothetical protein